MAICDSCNEERDCVPMSRRRGVWCAECVEREMDGPQDDRWLEFGGASYPKHQPGINMEGR